MIEKNDIPDLIRNKALELGFIACGFSPVVKLNDLEEYFTEWLGQGFHGEMDFLQNNLNVRLNPSLLLENAKTVISLAASCHTGKIVPDHPISRYAMGVDYHKVLKKRGRELLKWISQNIGQVNGRVFADSAPILEKEFARRAGLGWVGKNGLLINQEWGSWLFLCEIVITLEIREEVKEIPDRCGNCTRCIDACPTRAFLSPRQLDPRKCISYLTIEKKGGLPDEFHGQWSHSVYGCDICQQVCPWNSDIPLTPIAEFYPSEQVSRLKMADIGKLTEETFQELFDRTPVKRGGLSQILRNFEFIQEKEN